ncbi:MAG: TlpA disulfide reductase family protein [Armatimonadetes bacterium]|nr:TlpA disulfide reductase family protein [Armatimonadota bacterium]
MVLGHSAEGRRALLVDSNGNGDLADDAAPTWNPVAYRAQSGAALTMYRGSTTITAVFGGVKRPVDLGLLMLDPKDSDQPESSVALLCDVDYGYRGDIVLGGTTFGAALLDRPTAGNFARGLLLLDVNGNGVYDVRGEAYDASKPFSIKGVTYEITGMASSGATFTIVASKASVKEVLPPPNLGVGRVMPAFAVHLTDGKPVAFPAGYKGKLLLLDFWMMGAGPPVSRLPAISKAYQACHARGLEVLSICLDDAATAAKLTAFTTEHKMVWPQGCDGKSWAGDLPQMLAVGSIPFSLLVDGSSGKVLATTESLTIEKLEVTIAAAMKAALSPAK